MGFEPSAHRVPTGQMLVEGRSMGPTRLRGSRGAEAGQEAVLGPGHSPDVVHSWCGAG